MRAITLSLLLTAAPVVAAPAPLPKSARDTRPDLEKMQGEWEWSLQNGQVLKVVFAGRRVTWYAGTKDAIEEDVHLRPDACPKTFDTTRDGVGTCPGIYLLRGDVLIIRASKSYRFATRPSSFDGKDDGA